MKGQLEIEVFLGSYVSLAMCPQRSNSKSVLVRSDACLSCVRRENQRFKVVPSSSHFVRSLCVTSAPMCAVGKTMQTVLCNLQAFLYLYIALYSLVLSIASNLPRHFFCIFLRHYRWHFHFLILRHLLTHRFVISFYLLIESTG